MQNNTLNCNGYDLTIQDIYKFIRNKQLSLSLSDEIWPRVQACREFIDSLGDNKVVYGLNTGFGPMASHIIGSDSLEQLQANLVRSHAVGMGDPMESTDVLAAMIVRLNTFLKGYSGVSPELVRRLQAMVNMRITPVVPRHGGVGASGDLIQLAHVALGVMGEGEAIYNDQIHAMEQLCQRFNIEPHQYQTKEGLAMINGTSMMAGVGSLQAIEATRLMHLEIKCSAWALELMKGYDDSVSETLHKVRPFHGQQQVAAILRDILSSSQSLVKRQRLTGEVVIPEHKVNVISEEVQQVYSLRCSPQILGPIYDTILHVVDQLSIEINAVTDNPIIDYANKLCLHGGNFHGDYIATAMDQLRAGLAKMTVLSERRVNLLLHHKINQRYPVFLNRVEPGLTLALQGLQFVATSTTAHSKSLSYPHTIHSIPTNADNQDVVSMGTDSALMTKEVIDNAYTVMAIELVCLAQACDCNGERSRFSQSTQELYNFIREYVPELLEDRSMTTELNNLTHALRHKLDLPITIE